MLNSNPFNQEKKLISDEAELVFVSDMFVEDYVGGAELTSQAIIDSSPKNISCVRSHQVTLDLVLENKEKYWVFGNFSNLDVSIISQASSTLQYSVLEYDYKFCKYRSPEKHSFAEGLDCLCENTDFGKIIGNFFEAANHVWFMSENQSERYLSRFKNLDISKCTVLSSVFDDDFFVKVKELREEQKDKQRSGWIVLGSSSWIKGAEKAENWCINNKKEYKVLWNIPYGDVLTELSKAEGFVYLPSGGDTCPRMVIEAKLLGCKLHLNDYVEHSKELWFDTEDMFDTEAYLYAARERFWTATLSSMNYTPSISSYTTTRNCINQGYPWKSCIKSMLGFSNEVVVVDGGSTDGTWEDLVAMSKDEPRLKIYQEPRDWSDKRFAVYDGMQKAVARDRCTSEFLWQQDADEVVHEQDYDKIKNLCRNFPRNCVLVSLPVIEYWGSVDKVRCDVNPWKWRLSKNIKNITHGIPVQLRRQDEDGNAFAALGTDGCDYVFKDSGEIVPHASFYTEEVHQAKMAAVSGNKEALEQYEAWFNQVVESLPGVHHYSWLDIERKIKTYKGYWQKHWESLFDIRQEDNAENNMFFDKPWESVNDDEIKAMAQRLAEEMGGWIFHQKVDFSKSTPHINVRKKQPNVMQQD